MPYASVTYTATAGQTVFGPITFPGGAALQSSHIKVYVNGSLVSSTVTGSLSSPSVTIAATTLGDNVRIERQTPTTASTRLVDFEDGDVLTASDLDTAMLNNLYVAQEANDVGAQGLPLDPVNNVWNAGSRRIVNVNTPSNATDAANKAYVDSVAFTPGTGTVTSVGLNFPADFNVGNSPITNSGTINVEWAKIDSGNKVFGASLSTGLPEFRLLTAGDIPSLTASKISDFNTQVRTNRLDQMAVPTGSVSMNSQLITNVLTCQSANDAANKAYVDGLTFKSCVFWIDALSIDNTTVPLSYRRIYNNTGVTPTLAYGTNAYGEAGIAVTFNRTSSAWDMQTTQLAYDDGAFATSPGNILYTDPLINQASSATSAFLVYGKFVLGASQTVTSHFYDMLTADTWGRTGSSQDKYLVTGVSDITLSAVSATVTQKNARIELRFYD